MNRIEFSDYISNKIKPCLDPLGFTYIKSRLSYQKKSADGWTRISFGFYQFALTNNFNISFHVRKNVIEDKVVKFVDINPGDKKNTSTVLFILSSLLGYKYKDGVFEFTSIDELDKIIEQDVIPFLQFKLSQYCLKYNELENIYTLFTDPNDENHKLINFGYENCIRTLIIGHHLFPNDFDNVIKVCETEMMKMREKWPTSYDVELFDANFYNVASSLIFAD